MREPKLAAYSQVIEAKLPGRIGLIDNRKLARVAKLAGAPAAPSAGLEMHVRVGDRIEKEQPIMTVFAQTRGELEYSLQYLATHLDVIVLEER